MLGGRGGREEGPVAGVKDELVRGLVEHAVVAGGEDLAGVGDDRRKLRDRRRCQRIRNLGITKVN